MKHWLLYSTKTGQVLTFEAGDVRAPVSIPFHFPSAAAAALFMIDHELSPKDFYWEETVISK